MALVVCVIFAAVVVRLVQVQALQAGRYSAYGVSERTRTIALPALRGAVQDRNGKVLALSVPMTSIYADPQLVTDPVGEAKELSPALGTSPDQLQRELSATGQFVYLARTVPDDTAAAVRKLNLPGIAYLQEPKRFAPDGQLAASVLGTVGTDGRGLSGLEYQYDQRLVGRPGQLQVQQGLHGQTIPGTPQQVEAAVPGTTLRLTLDSAIQYQTEQVLGNEIVSSHAKGGMAVIMQSQTGKIVALANLVADANSPTGVSEASSDMAVTSVYEPGSVMKGVTFSAALESGAVTPATRFQVPYSTRLADATIHDAESHPTEFWSVPDILAYSSNVGTLHISQSLGPNRVYDFMRAFGLGSKTTLGVPGESSGLLPQPSRWSATSIGTVPIGQGVAVTAMQILDVYNTIANGGRFVGPQLVDGWVGADGSLQAPASPATRTVVSARTARQMTAMLEDVVASGTGTSAAVPGYDVAGKTGTAQIPDTSRGGYQAGAYTASFVGFVPAENPQLTAIVVVDRPTPVFYGGSIAAPVFSQIVSYALRQLQIAPPTPKNLGADVPPIDASAAAAGSDDGPATGPLPVSLPPAPAPSPTPSPSTNQAAGPGPAHAPTGGPTRGPAPTTTTSAPKR